MTQVQGITSVFMACSGINEKSVFRDPVREKGEKELRKAGVGVGDQILRGISAVVGTFASGFGLAARPWIFTSSSSVMMCSLANSHNSFWPQSPLIIKGVVVSHQALS